MHLPMEELPGNHREEGMTPDRGGSLFIPDVTVCTQIT